MHPQGVYAQFTLIDWVSQAALVAAGFCLGYAWCHRPWRKRK